MVGITYNSLLQRIKKDNRTEGELLSFLLNLQRQMVKRTKHDVVDKQELSRFKTKIENSSKSVLPNPDGNRVTFTFEDLSFEMETSREVALSLIEDIVVDLEEIIGRM